MSCGPRAYRRAVVRANRRLGGEVFELVAVWDGPAPAPGQFFMLRAERSAVLLGRPISVHAADDSSLSFVIAERGTGTRELAELREGESLMLEGPLGGAWPLPADEGGRVALVGGGIGLAPLFFLARSLAANSYDLFAGYRSGSWGLEGLAPGRLRVFTEDGSVGARGRVLDDFDPAPFSAIYACGPEPMLRKIAEIAATSGKRSWLSLERRMACGVGACLGCTVRTTGGNRRACVEGPIFGAEEVLFDD